MVLWAVLGGFVLDALFGDPAWLPHPVVLMGRCISRLEKFLRARLPGTPQGELLGGAVTAFCLPVGTFLVTSLVCLAAAKLSPWLGLAVQMFWCGQALAARGLAQESTNVYNELVRNDLPAARKAVSRIVGRDTQNLTAEGVTKAAVETVAENASDGVIAPLLYMLIGGAPLALTYKAINTMDSMLGYKNEKYLYFGRAAAKLDDLANYIPSRLAALLWVAAAAFTGNDAKGAWRIWRRDRRNHASPNSAQTESACAGALGVQLAGPAYYFGEYYPKPTIGDALRPIEPQDILRANRMMYVASGFALAWGAAIRGFLCRALREKLAVAEGVPAEWLLCGNGAADLIFRLALAAKPRTALVTAPTFAEYATALEMAGCTVERYFLREENDFAVTKDLLNAVHPGTNMVFLCQPNNPTGQLAEPALVEALLRRCEAVGAVLAVDECFLDFLPEGEGLSAKHLLKNSKKLIILKAFTKLYGMAGVRLGYCLCSDTELLARMRAAGQPWAVSSLAQAAGIAALDETEYVAQVRALIEAQRPVLADGLRALGLRVIEGRANYLLFRAPEALGEALRRKGAVLRSCGNYPGLDASWYRTAVRTENENRQLLALLAETLPEVAQ